MAASHDLNVESFDREVLQEAAPVLVDFWSRTCPHCLHLGPEFEQAAAGAEGRVKFAKLCVQDNAMPVFSQYQVMGVPTMILFRGGKEVARRSGAATSQDILAWLDDSLREK